MTFFMYQIASSSPDGKISKYNSENNKQSRSDVLNHFTSMFNVPFPYTLETLENVWFLSGIEVENYNEIG